MVSLNYSAFITNNFFDSGTVDGSNTNTVANVWPTFTMNNNVGQTISIIIGADAGIKAMTPADNLTTPSGTLYLTSGNASGTALLGPHKDGLRLTSTTNAAFTYIPDNTQRAIIWAIPLNQYVPQGAYITQIVMVAYATTKFSNNSVLQTWVNNATSWTGTGSETTPLTYDFGNTGSYVPNTHITLTINIPYGTARVAPDVTTNKFPDLIMEGAPFSDNGGGVFYINPVVVTYRW